MQSKYEPERFIYFLLVFDFYLLLFNNFDQAAKSSVLVFDNADSISDIDQQRYLLNAVNEFIFNCNLFFGVNIENINTYKNIQICNFIKSTKLVFFLVTRIATSQEYQELSPDMENMYGWHSIKMPENYYNLSAIIKYRINYYQGSQNNNFDKRMHQIFLFANVLMNVPKFKKLFNNNYRYMVNAICAITTKYSVTPLIKEVIDLATKENKSQEFSEGITGIIYSLLLNYFKENKIYNEKLHLSECQSDGSISLSRIILTIIRECNEQCTLFDLLKLLSPFFEINEICDTLFDISEKGRDIWRRLITISNPFPKNIYCLRQLGKDFENEQYDQCKICEISICSAGNAYVEDIVPHFEFMLSRRKYSYDYITNYNYYPLYSLSSEKIIENGHEDSIKYVFERKIDWVYQDVKDCCANSSSFSDKLIAYFSKYDAISRDEFINNTCFNYHPISYEGLPISRQSYESRLIFRHIGYIESYRQYLLLKYIKDAKKCIDINKRLVERIEKYLNLYFDSDHCYQSSSQDIAANDLLDKIQKISQSHYRDCETKIQV